MIPHLIGALVSLAGAAYFAHELWNIHGGPDRSLWPMALLCLLTNLLIGVAWMLDALVR